MSEKKIMVFLFLAALLIIGCVGMRDYVGERDGYFGLDVKRQFGEGNAQKDYFVTDDGIGIVVHDTKSEIISKIGYPDNREKTLEGYDCWTYEEYKFKLFFDGDYLHEWNQI